MIEPFKKKSITRLKKARGQIDGILTMIEKDKYEPEIITQTLAASGALKSVINLLLESHLATLDLSQTKNKNKLTKEILKAWKLSTK